MGIPTLRPDHQEFIDYAYMIIKGLDANFYFKNTTNCFDRVTNFTFTDLYTYSAYINDPQYAWHLKMFKTTELI